MAANAELSAQCEAALGEASEHSNRADHAEAECESLAGLRDASVAAAASATQELAAAEAQLATALPQLEAARALVEEGDAALVQATAHRKTTRALPTHTILTPLRFPGGRHEG